jgi:trigger factor
MHLNVEELGTLKRKISVEVPLLEVEATYNEVYAQIKQHITVKGFRPGKFPRQMAEKRFQDVMRQEATRSLLPKYFEQALSEMEARPATQPRFENLEIDQKLPFKFEAEFEIVPTFELPEPGDFTLEEKEVELEPEEVDQRIEEMRRSRAVLEDKGEAPAEDGDVVTVDFQGKLDGELFQGGSAQDQRIEPGSGQFLKDFEEPLAGAKAGEKKSFDVTFPEDYGEETLAGKTAQFDVDVKKVEKKVPPELDEAFYSQFGQFDSLEAFRENVEQQMRQEKERAIQMEYQQAVADQLRDLSSFDVPETLVEQNLEQFEHGLSHSDPEALKDEKKLAKRKKEEGERIKGNLRVNYLVDEWARQHDISVSKEEVQQRFYLQAYMMQQNPTELLNSPYGETMIFQLEQQLLTNKVLDDLVAHILGKHEPGPAGEADAAPAEGEAPAGEASPEGGQPEETKGAPDEPPPAE